MKQKILCLVILGVGLVASLAKAEPFPTNNEILRLEASPGFESVTLSWIKFHESVLSGPSATNGKCEEDNLIKS